MEWISVLDELPKKNQIVIFYSVCSIIGVFDGEDFTYRGVPYCATHWMPLPEPPKKGEE